MNSLSSTWDFFIEWKEKKEECQDGKNGGIGQSREVKPTWKNKILMRDWVNIRQILADLETLIILRTKLNWSQLNSTGPALLIFLLLFRYFIIIIIISLILVLSCFLMLGWKFFYVLLTFIFLNIQFSHRIIFFNYNKRKFYW